MPDEEIHSAVYCPRCNAKVKYQYPKDATADQRDEAILRAFYEHYDAAHPAR